MKSTDVYEWIIGRIFGLLDKGTVPWRKPWRAEWPQNLFTKHRYSGINYLLLTNAGFGSPYWATKNQIAKHGGSVKPGQEDKPQHVVYVLPRQGERLDDLARIAYVDGPDFLMGAHEVFNSEQSEGLDRILHRRFGRSRPEPLAEAERIVAGMPQCPPIKQNPELAYYSPTDDFVSVPPRDLFPAAEEYYSTLFHELVHSTGHSSRLKRQSLLEFTRFGDHEYSHEELVAETGAAMLCGLTGIAPKTVENSASYIASWLRVLKSDRRMLTITSYQAQKACDFVTGQVIDKKKEKEGYGRDIQS